MKYKHTHSQLPPFLFTSHLDGKKYIVPGWQEVHPNTTFDDIKWVRKKVEVKKTEIQSFEFPSSSSDEIYITRKYTNPDSTIKYSCNCPGSFRSRGNCKHIKEIRDGKTK